jgi:5-methylcytosine-specific restriction enzyme A
MGGSPSRDVPSNLLDLCAVTCHRWVESNRAESYDAGWLVRGAQNPAEVPVLYRGQWVFLDDTGLVHVVVCSCPSPCLVCKK